jgi:hypothetical protein
LQNPQISAAVREIAARGVEIEAAASVEFLARVRDDPHAPLASRIKAADSLLDRAGLSGEQRIAVDHTHRDLTGVALLERLRELGQRYKIDVDALLSERASPMRLIDAPPR